MERRHYIETKAEADAAPVKKVCGTAEEAVAYFKTAYQTLFKKGPSEPVQKDLCFAMISNEPYFCKDSETGASILVKEAY